MTAWTDNQHALREHLKHDKLEDFLRWSTVEKTMFVGDVGFVAKEYRDIMYGDHPYITAETFDKFAPVLTEPKVGNPKLLWGWTSGNLIHQLYHLKQWLDRSQLDVSQLSAICEFGAGYGAMALICRRLGFKGQYYIEDLPELKQIQGYYLHNTVRLDNIAWRVPKRCNLFIALHSLGEMPVSDRDGLLSQVKADNYLFASSYEFEGVDNQGWFKGVAESRPDLQWEFYLHPFQENAFYMVGTRV